MTELGTVQACWRYPVKSMQGLPVDSLQMFERGVGGDRVRALIDTATGHLMSAKRTSVLLDASADDDSITLPDGTVIPWDDATVDARLSEWLGKDVRLSEPLPGHQLSYEMTFDPPDDDAEYVEIPAPVGTFVDLAPLHVVSRATLDGAAATRPELTWDVRRFRPNLVLDTGGDAFVENGWVGRTLRFSSGAAITVSQPTVRCAMPLRAQPEHAGHVALGREPELFRAMSELNTEYPNHLGVYVDVEVPGRVAVGDTVELV
ncbi:MAG: MOSC domain-containing protein [Actinomycetota bacterium]|nr:MOSC domain-containing protein [Actinomycetota bacterium]